MAGQNLVAVFETRERAQSARDSLIERGFHTADIRLSNEDKGERAARMSPARESVEDDSGFFGWLFGSDVSEQDQDLYRSHMQGGRTVLSVRVEKNADAIEDLLERYDPIDVHGDGQGGSTSSASVYGAGAAGEAPAPDGDTRVIPIVEEQLQVGKRTEERRHKIRTYAVETPVEQEVKLRDEKVVIERRPVSEQSRTSGTPSNRIHGTEFEVVERHEVPVARKESRTVEEVVVHKEAHDRTQKVADTVRKTEVEVDGSEGVPGGSKRK